MSKDLSKLSDQELIQEMKERKLRKSKQLENNRKKYESSRKRALKRLQPKAIKLNAALKEYKTLCHEIMQEQEQALREYGLLPSKSKGGFSIASEAGDFKITRRRDTDPKWDERSTKAVNLIKDFLADCVKKSAQKEFDILMTFLEKNAAGDLEYSKVMHLLKHEDKYEDDRWKEGLRLLKESYTIQFKGFGYEFKCIDEGGKLQNLSLNFSAL